MSFFVGFNALISAVFAVAFSLAASWLLKEKEIPTIAYAIFFGGIIWIVNKYSTKSGFLVALVFLLICIFATVILMIRWHLGAVSWKEFACFSIINLTLVQAGYQAAYIIAPWVKTIPKILGVICCAYFIFDRVRFKLELEKAESEEDLEDYLSSDQGNPLDALKKMRNKFVDFVFLMKGEEIELEEEEKPEKVDFSNEEPIDFGLNT